jgi:two-component system cell cycle response regulator CpdR
MISGYAQERMRAHNLDALVHRIIAKPFSLEEICEAVKNALTLPAQAS